MPLSYLFPPELKTATPLLADCSPASASKNHTPASSCWSALSAGLMAYSSMILPKVMGSISASTA
ncbi:hypothetical protein [Herminiimonas sp. KBW02]|uniref:hypothetical protein n=1 Tax=Herminiimonas sp. KBW02 TaxID=2153363 RepID=UPI000F5B679E|nr:hypothetical protein [Herminiimonas sp. KBW02]